MPSNLSSRGFTLLELLFIVMIVSILLWLAYPHITSALDQAAYIECESRLEMLRRAKSTYVLDHLGQGSPSNSDQEAVFRVYLPQRFTLACPRDPVTPYSLGSPYTDVYNLYRVTKCPYCANPINLPEGARVRSDYP